MIEANETTTPDPAPAGAAAPSFVEAMGLPVLSHLIQRAPDGIAVLDAEQRFLYVNPAGCRILGSTLAELTGQAAPFPDAGKYRDQEPAAPDDPRRLLVLDSPNGASRELDCTSSRHGAGSARRTLVLFRDVTTARRRDERLTSFARTASSLVYARSLQEALDRVSADVLPPTGAVAAALVLVDPETHAFQMAGTAGLDEDYLERLEESRRLGAPLATSEAFATRKPVVRQDVQDHARRDPRFAPVKGLLSHTRGVAAIAVPMLVRDQPLGVLTALYPPGHHPDQEDASFLTAMAEQASVAVDNARLLANVQGKAALEERHRLARELHDSVSQALFSMSLQARAVELAVLEAGNDPQGKAARGLGELRALTQGALAEMRALIFQLRPEALHEEGLVAAVRKHAAAVSARHGMDLSVHAPDRLPLGEQAEEELLRVVQEAVHNCVKHASPEHIEVRLAEEPAASGTLVVEVADDGAGFDATAAHPGHLGMETMRERTERLGGRLQVDSSEAGSTVRAVLPAILRPPADSSAHD
jgi:PAS domain S-box-containing protein